MTASLELIPRRCIYWLLVGYVLLIIPGLPRLPLWQLAYAVILPVWHLGMTLGWWARLGAAVRMSLVLAGVGLFFGTLSGGFNVDSVARFFVLSLSLKWLELGRRRDVYVLVFILCYLAAVNFLFQTQVLWTLVNLGGVLTLFNALQWLQAPAGGAVVATWRRMARLLLISAPLIVALFIFFPRVGPLWSVPLVNGPARTGLSDHIAPGDLANLVRDDSRAFRASFAGQLPPPAERYWRGLVLDRFDGERWMRSHQPGRSRPGKVLSEATAGPLAKGEYEILLEPTHQRWAFALSRSRPASDNIHATRDGLVAFPRPVESSVRYRLRRLAGSVDAQVRVLTARERSHYLTLPTQGNPQARQWARTLAAKSPTPSALAVTLLRYFHQKPFFYTLRPPDYGANPIDELLFSRRRGFCAHYASATAFVLRAAGVPARIVVGYLGGEPSIDNSYLIIRQYDAHAWVEFWQEGVGWIRMDPTAAIAPSRVENGLRDSVADQADFLVGDWTSTQRYRDLPGVNWLNLQIDRINYQWQRWVVGYEGKTQLQLFSHWGKGIGLRELGLYSAGLIGVAALLGVLLVQGRQWRRSARDPYRRLLVQWYALLQGQGLAVAPTQTPLQAAALCSPLGPAFKARAETFARLISNHYYASDSPDTRRQLQQLLRQMRALSHGRKRA